MSGLWPFILASAILALGLVASLAISRWWHWPAGGAIALLAAAPLVPHLEILSRLSTDDLLPLLGLGLLIVGTPRPGLTRSRLLQVGLLGVAVAIIARLLSTITHEATVLEALVTLTAAVGRPLFLVLVATYVAVAVRSTAARTRTTAALALLGTFEAVFSLISYSIPLRGVGVRPGLWYESLTSCDLRITGTLGLSANHIGAIFIVTLPVTIGLAIAASGRRQWLWAGAAALQSTALVLTFTRSSILLGAVAAVFIFLFYLRFRLMAATVSMGLVLLIGMTSLACTPSSAPGPEPRPSEAPSPTIAPDDPGAVLDRFGDPTDRLALWYAAGRMTLDYPATGVGIGRMVEVMRSDPDRYVFTPFGKAVSSAHNTILLAGAETGIAGALGTLVINLVVALLALQAVVFRRRSPLLVATGVAVLVFLAQGMVNNLFTVPATGTLLALLVGVLAAGREGIGPDPSESVGTQHDHLGPR